ncbi:MAG: hypothetical protein ABIJ25_04080 [Pseudomonadota bacterium]|nr:hypothetical protein [Verrucomicrobiota bacterium]
MDKGVRYLPRDREHLPKMFPIHLNESARRERRTLMLLSILALFIAYTGAVPTSFSGGGFMFLIKDPPVIYWSLVACEVYFLLTFWLYSLEDFRLARRERVAENAEAMTVGTTRIASLLPLWCWSFARAATYFLWLSLEFLLPYVLGILATAFLLYRAANGTSGP